MKLQLLDKMLIPSLLKKEGTFEEMIINKDIRSKLEITQNEVKEYSITTLEGGGVSWNKEGSDISYDIDFTELELNQIKECLKNLQENKKLTESHIDLYKKFIN
jgi:hypothetical protein